MRQRIRAWQKWWREILARELGGFSEANRLALTPERELHIMQGAGLPPFVQGLNVHTREQQIEGANLLFQGALILANAAGVVLSITPTPLVQATTQPQPPPPAPNGTPPPIPEEAVHG